MVVLCEFIIQSEFWILVNLVGMLDRMRRFKLHRRQSIHSNQNPVIMIHDM